MTLVFEAKYVLNLNYDLQVSYAKHVINLNYDLGIEVKYMLNFIMALVLQAQYLLNCEQDIAGPHLFK